MLWLLLHPDLTAGKLVSERGCNTVVDENRRSVKAMNSRNKAAAPYEMNSGGGKGSTFVTVVVPAATTSYEAAKLEEALRRGFGRVAGSGRLLGVPPPLKAL